MARGVYGFAERESAARADELRRIAMTIVGRGVYRNGKRMDLDDVPFDELADQCLLADDFSWIGLYDPTQDGARHRG